MPWTLRLFLRFLRKGELLLLLAALIVSVCTVTSISLFVSRIGNTLVNESANFLAADAAISGSLPIPPEWIEQAKQKQLEVAQYIDFRSMLLANDQMLLVQVKAVDDKYPLRGTLESAQKPYEKGTPAERGPLSGALWLSSAVMSGLSVEKNSYLNIGELALRVEAVLAREPDDTSNGFGVSPRVMMNIDDVAATQAVQAGSRVDYTLLLAGSQNTLQELKAALPLGEHFRWRDARESNATVSNNLQKAERFLMLAGSLSVMLAGVAVALSAQRFAKGQNANVALFLSFGLGPRATTALYLRLIFLLALCGLSAGLALGWALQSLLIVLLGAALPANLAAPSGAAFLVGAGAAVLSLLAFCLPPILALRKIPPSQILRNPRSQGLVTWQSVALGVLALVALVYLYSRDIKMTGIALLALGLSAVLGALVISALIILLEKAATPIHGAVKIAIANLKRQRVLSVLQIFVFSTVFLLLLILLQVRNGMLDRWQAQIPDDAPNHFIFNIFDDDLAAVQKRFQDQNIAVRPFYPMTRGRIVSVNGIALAERIATDAQMNYRRELNLTWSEDLGADNTIVEGEWWQSPNTEMYQLSVEEEYAKGIALNVGDKVLVSIAGIEVEAEVASLRLVQWDSMNPNFFVIFNRPIEGVAVNWMTSFFLAEDNRRFIADLSRDYPTLTLMAFAQALERIQEMIEKITLAVEFVLALVLATASLVMLTSVQASVEERKKISALLRSFGASRRFVSKVMLLEFALLGALAGLFAAAGAEACLYFVEVKIFNFEATFHLWMWFLSPLATTILVCTLGFLSTRALVKVPPLKVLRA